MAPAQSPATTAPAPLVLSGPCTWLDGCSERIGLIADGGKRKTPRELVPFCAAHRHMLRTSPTARMRHGVPDTLMYGSRIAPRGLTTSADQAMAVLVVRMVTTLGGWERVREIAGAGA